MIPKVSSVRIKSVRSGRNLNFLLLHYMVLKLNSIVNAFVNSCSGHRLVENVIS